MNRSRAPLLALAVLLLAGTTAPARISHGYSGNLVIDTVAAVNDDPGARPGTSDFGSIHPNPFNPRTTIAFDLAEAGSLKLAIYDMTGRLIRVLDSGSRSAGHYQATWAGQDDDGRAVASGTYFCRLITAHGVQTKKMTLAR